VTETDPLHLMENDIVFPAKRYWIILEGNEPVVGDGDAMCSERL
jgi:hypothetical protein